MDNPRNTYLKVAYCEDPFFFFTKFRLNLLIFEVLWGVLFVYVYGLATYFIPKKNHEWIYTFIDIELNWWEGVIKSVCLTVSLFLKKKNLNWIISFGSKENKNYMALIQEKLQNFWS